MTREQEIDELSKKIHIRCTDCGTEIYSGGDDFAKTAYFQGWRIGTGTSGTDSDPLCPKCSGLE